jgi:hypothetical protein
MIPPPYSSAASPDDLSISLQNYAIPRSASQQGYNNIINNSTNNNNNNINSSNHGSHIDTQLLTGNSNALNNRPMSVPNTNHASHNNSHYQFRSSESANFAHLFLPNNDNENIANHNYHLPTSSNSNSTMTTTHTGSVSGSSRNHNVSISDDDDDEDEEEIFHQASEGNATDNGNQASIYHSNETMLSLSAAMIDKIAYSRQTNDHTKLDMIQKQLEKCCELIQQQQQQIQQTRSHFNITTSFDSASESPISCEIAKKMSESAIMGLGGYMNSNTESTVSSLANLNSLSPPLATSPTQEVKELLEQIRQLKDKTFSDEDLNFNLNDDDNNKSSNSNRNNGNSIENRDLPRAGPSSEVRAIQPQTFARPSTSSAVTTTVLKRPTTLSNKRRFFNMKNRSVYIPISCNFASPNGFNTKLRSPISCGSGSSSGGGTSNTNNVCNNTNTAGVFMNKSRGIKNRNVGWSKSKSAPTTPGTFNANCISDHSPLLYEQDEDAETEADQNC